jgi:hypothetical protein
VERKYSSREEEAVKRKVFQNHKGSVPCEGKSDSATNPFVFLENIITGEESLVL